MQKLQHRYTVLNDTTTSASEEATFTGSEEEGSATIKSTKSKISEEDTVDS